jgi:hypothetical protein
VLHIRQPKTDQDGQGDQIAIPNGRKLKPVEALVAWLDRSGGDHPGAHLPSRHGRLGNRLITQSVALIVKRWGEGDHSPPRSRTADDVPR